MNTTNITTKELRIAIVGSQSTGKTTLATQLSKSLDIPLITEIARRWNIEKVAQTELIDIQKEMLKLQIEEESKHKKFISDRSTIDNLAYWVHNVAPIVDKNDTILYAAKALSNSNYYSHIFLLTPEFYPVNDGFRSVNIIYQLQIAETINTILRLYGIRHHKLTGTKEERFIEALEIINGKENLCQ